MTIYGDVLVILNLYINYFLVRGAALILRKPVSGKRCLFSAAIGAAASLTILLPPLPFFLIAAIKMVSAALMVLAAFGKQDKRGFAVSLLCLFVISFGFAGIMLGLWLFCAPLGMVFDNGVAYFDIPIAAAAGLTAAGYVIVKAVRRIADKRLDCTRIQEVIVKSGEHICVLRGLADTGNGLRDVFSGKGVVVCREESIGAIIPKNVREYIGGKLSESGGIRLLPCRTVSSETLIPVFSVDSVTIGGRSADVLIGVSRMDIGGEFDCVFDPKAISL